MEACFKYEPGLQDGPLADVDVDFSGFCVSLTVLLVYTGLAKYCLLLGTAAVQVARLDIK